MEFKKNDSCTIQKSSFVFSIAVLLFRVRLLGYSSFANRPSSRAFSEAIHSPPMFAISQRLGSGSRRRSASLHSSRRRKGRLAAKTICELFVSQSTQSGFRPIKTTKTSTMFVRPKQSFGLGSFDSGSQNPSLRAKRNSPEIASYFPHFKLFH